MLATPPQKKSGEGRDLRGEENTNVFFIHLWFILATVNCITTIIFFKVEWGCGKDNCYLL